MLINSNHFQQKNSLLPFMGLKTLISAKYIVMENLLQLELTLELKKLFTWFSRFQTGLMGNRKLACSHTRFPCKSLTGCRPVCCFRAMLNTQDFRLIML